MSFSSFDEVSTTTGIILRFPLDLISFNTSNPSTLRALELAYDLVRSDAYSIRGSCVLIGCLIFRGSI
jgi:hypothetical protein